MAKDKKAESGSEDWGKGKTMGAKEMQYRGGDKQLSHQQPASKSNLMPAYAAYLRDQAVNQKTGKFDEKHYDKLMRVNFGPMYNMSPDELAAIQKKMVEKFGPVDAGEIWEQEGYASAGMFQGSSADAVAQLKKFEDTKRVSASKKGMKGGRFGFDGGYGKGAARKGKVRAGVSSDMDAKNEEALNNSGLLG